MTKLNQILAIEKGVKNQSESEFTRIYHLIEKPAPFSGISRTYESAIEDGEQLPSQSTKVQLVVDDLLEQLEEALVRLFDVTATKDYANLQATADIVVDGEALLKAVPVTHLLFLEKKLVDLNTFILNLPVLDQSEEWTPDNTTPGAYRSEPVRTIRQKKIQRAIVLYPATDKHPAQTQMVTEDVLDGYWTTTNFSGNLDANRKKELIDRVRTLQSAVKYAREEANSVEVTDQKVGGKIFSYLFGAPSAK